MNVKKLNEKLSTFLNEQEDIISAIKNGSYKGKDIDTVVLSNLDEFTEDDIVNIFNNKKYAYQGAMNLFPYNLDKKSYSTKIENAYNKYMELRINKISGPSDISRYYI